MAAHFCYCRSVTCSTSVPDGNPCFTERRAFCDFLRGGRFIWIWLPKPTARFGVTPIDILCCDRARAAIGSRTPRAAQRFRGRCCSGLYWRRLGMLRREAPPHAIKLRSVSLACQCLRRRSTKSGLFGRSSSGKRPMQAALSSRDLSPRAGRSSICQMGRIER